MRRDRQMITFYYFVQVVFSFKNLYFLKDCIDPIRIGVGRDERKFENTHIKILVSLLLKLPGSSEKEAKDTNKPA